jgi:Tol biopolymer transport system component
MRPWLCGGAICAALPLAVLGCGGPDVTAPATEAPPVPTGVTANLSQTGRIAFVSNRAGNDEIYVMNADGTGLIRLTNNAAADEAPAWSPDGAKIAFVSHRAGNDEIYVVNANGSGGLVRLTNNAAADGAPAWSPDGTKIAFVSDRAGNSEIYSMKPDGSGVTRLTNNAAADGAPAWSPLGTKIAFVSHRAGNDEIYDMNPDGSGVKRLTNNAAVDGQPAWSFDGSKLAFVSHRSGNDEIYAMDPTDVLAVPVQLTSNAAVDGSPDWAPNRTIAFHSNRDGDFEIYEMNEDGSGVTQVTHNGVFDGNPALTLNTPQVGSVSVTPTIAGVDAGTSRQFTATVTDDPYNAGVTWSVAGSGCSGSACGTVTPGKSASGSPVKYTAPLTVPTPNDVVLTATAVTNTGFSAPATIVVTKPGVLTVAVFPTSVTIRSGSGQAKLTAYVFHDPSHAGVNWSVGLGSISPKSSASGVAVTYTAPASFTNGQTFAEARSAAKPTASDTAVIHLNKTPHSCPLVYSWDGKHWRLDSGTFGGAIVRALTRTDLDNLDFATPQNGVLRLKLADELNETDYIDGIDVLAVDHDSGVTVAPDGAGRLYSLGRMTEPTGAWDFRGGDVLSQIKAADGRNWESSPAARDTARTADIRDGIELSFPKPDRARTARLVVDANNSPWAAVMMQAFVAAHGRATQAWYDSLDAAPTLARQMFAKLAREAFLSVSVRIDEHWEQQGTVWEAGPEVVKRQVVPLDLSRVRGHTVQIRLESVPSFWLIDHVALDVSHPRPLRVTRLSATTALDQRGRNVLDLLAPVDGRFLKMETGEFAELRYQVPKLRTGQVRTFLVQSTGYYRIHSPEVGDPDLALLHRLLTEPHAISRIAVARMNGLLLALHVAKQ